MVLLFIRNTDATLRPISEEIKSAISKKFQIPEHRMFTLKRSEISAIKYSRSLEYTDTSQLISCYIWARILARWPWESLTHMDGGRVLGVD